MTPEQEQDTSRPPILDRLCDPRLYNHEVTGFHWIETHISWVLLTGSYAYKFKKPVDYGFVDFSSLEKRRRYCHREVELNRRLAPDLYQGVVEVTGTPGDPRWNGPGRPQEFAVKMVEFEQSELFARRVERDEVSGDEIERLAQVIAEFHRGLDPMDTGEPHATPDQVRQAINDSLNTLLGNRDTVSNDSLERIQTWTDDRFDSLEPVLRRRRSEGYVRECHGDLHLENIVRHRGSIEVFDCIEFNESFRWIDVFCEVAFLSMDLKSRDCSGLAHRFLNRYLSRTGFYEDLELIPYYEVYRALVRGKVDVLKNAQGDPSDAGASPDAADYVQLARELINPDSRFLVITHGFSGTGKTTISSELVERTGSIRVRSDVERKRLAGLDPDESSGSSLGDDLYTKEMTHRTYGRLQELAGQILEAGHSVVVDATFLGRSRRDEFHALAEQMGVPFRILHCEVPEEELRKRLVRRSQRKSTVSEAGPSVLDRQLVNHDPLNDRERNHTTTVQTGANQPWRSGLDNLLESLGTRD